MTANPQHSFSTLSFVALRRAASASDTTLYLIPGGGAELQEQWVPGRNLYLTITNPSADIEVVKVTAIYADEVTVERGQDGTTAQAWGAGSIVSQRGVAADYNGFLQKGAFLTGSVNPNGVYSVSYPGQKYYQNGSTACEKRWFIGVSGTTWDVFAGDRWCLTDFVRQDKALTPYPALLELNAIDQNGDTIMASGYGGTAISSDGGATWTHDTLDHSSTADVFIAYGNGTWVRAQSNSHYNWDYSTDGGATWTSFSFDQSWESVIYALRYLGGYFIMVGWAGEIQTSPDGITWTRRHTGEAYPFHDVAYDGTTWVVCGGNSSYPAKLWKSTDLSTWTEIFHGISTGNVPFYSVVYGGTRWVAGGNCSTTDTNIIYSDDLSTWHGVLMPTNYGISANIIYANGLFVMATTSSDETYPIFTSADATSWTGRSISLLSSIYAMAVYDILYTGTKFIAVGEAFYQQNSAGQAIATSTDGTTWAQIPSPHAQFINTFTSITATQALFLASGASQQMPSPTIEGNQPIVVYASAGIDPGLFTGVILDYWDTGVSVQSVGYTGAYYLASATYTGEVIFFGLYKSGDGGVTFQDTGWGDDIGNAIYGWAVDPDGNNGDGLVLGMGDNHLIETDKDLSYHNTRLAYDDVGIPSFEAYDVAFGNGLFVAVGSHGRIWTSPDGANPWTRRTAAGGYNQQFNAIAFGGGVFVAVGEYGEIQYSSDGITWAEATADASYGGDFYGVTYAEGYFLICGMLAEIQVSSNLGQTWQHMAAASGFSRSFYDINYTYPYLVVVGDRGEIQVATG